MKLYKLVILTILFKYLTSSKIIYEFKRDFRLNESLTENDIFLKLSYNDIYTNIKIGTALQELKVGISFKMKSLILLGSNIKKTKDRKTFDETQSSSYHSIERAICYQSQMKDANISEEYINLNTINRNEKIKFILVNELENESLTKNDYEPIYFSGCIGLAINSQFQFDNPDSLPIYLSENYKSIYNSAFSVKFNIKEPGNYNGKLIMNGYPHEFDEKNYNIKQYKTTKIQSVDNFNDWCFTVDNTYYGENIAFHNNYIIFRIEIGIILAPLKFMEQISKKYFEQYKDSHLCEEKNLELMFDNYNYYVCNKDINITNFENINFELKDNNFNFTLDYKDLFYEYNNKYYFLIAGSKGYLHDFIIGSVLMKKYEFVFDKFNSNIGFYDFSIIVEEKNYFIIYIVVISVLVLLIILVLIYLIWKFFNKPRNSRKNELNDDYNYISAINPDEKD